MSDQFVLLSEPLLQFGGEQVSEDPHDGLALFGPAESRPSIGDHVAIGTNTGLGLWSEWTEIMNSPAACEDPSRHRPWPPFPGFDVAFGCKWQRPVKKYSVEANALDLASRKANRHERAYASVNLFLDPIRTQISRLDTPPAIAVCIVPDEIYGNCRPKSFVVNTSDVKKTKVERSELKADLEDRKSGQMHIPFDEPRTELEQYGMSPDFRRQLKARVMQHDIPVQIIRQSTLIVTEEIRRGLKGTNPLSDRLWNLGTGLYYKCGRKPWITPWAREGVCYIGLAYKRDESDRRTACCAAQMFLDSGDGIVFVGEFGPWYSESSREFHLTKNAAKKLLEGTIETYRNQDGRPLKEIFLHARSGLLKEEYEGFLEACPKNVNLVGIRVRTDNSAPRLFRHDDNPSVSDRGKHPVLRGLFWRRTARHGFLFTTGFKPRLATYDGWEIPVPLAITIQFGSADIIQVATDILGLTKLNYNACRLGGGQPITVKYSDKIGEILLSNPEVDRSKWRYNLKYYI